MISPRPRSVPALGFLGACLLTMLAAPAAGHPSYQKVFYSAYTKGDGVDKDFRKLTRKAKCNLCHQGKKDRKNYNAYGIALLDHLTEGDEKNKEKALAALEAVFVLPSGEADSPTFGELIDAGELPGGPLEDSKKEPTD